MSFNLPDVLDALKEKKEANKQMRQSLDNYITNTKSKINKSHYMKAKDYVHYYGNGWSVDGDPFGENPVDDKFPDRLRPVFKNIFNALVILKEFDMLDMAKPYLDSLKDKGIEISFKFTKNDFELDNSAKNSIIQELNNYQTTICDEADFIRDSIKAMIEDTNMTKYNANLIVNKISKLPNLSDKDRDKLLSVLLSNNVDNSMIEDICAIKVPNLLA